jgi:hypothetical protein
MSVDSEEMRRSVGSSRRRLGVERRDSRHTVALGTSWTLWWVRVVRMRFPAHDADPYALDFDVSDDASYSQRKWSVVLGPRQGWHVTIALSPPERH